MDVLKLWLFIQALFVTVFFVVLCHSPSSNISEFIQQEVESYTWRSSIFDCVCVDMAELIILCLLWRATCLKYAPLRLLALLVPLGAAITSACKFVQVSVDDWHQIYGESAMVSTFLIGSATFGLLNVVTTCFVLAKAATTAYTAIPIDAETAGDTVQTHGADTATASEHPKKLNAKAMQWLLGLAKPERGILMFATLMLVLSSLSQLAMPYIFGKVVDAVGGSEKSATQLMDSILVLIVAFGFGSIASFFRGWLFTLAGQRLVARLRVDVFRAITIQEITFFDDHRTGDLISRLASDTQVLQDAATVNLSMLLRFAIQIIGATIALFMLSWLLTLVMLSMVPLVMIGTVAYGKYVRRIRKEFQEQLGAASSVAEEMLGSMRTVKSFSREREVQKVYERSVHKSYILGGRLAMASGLFVGGVGFVPQVAIALVVWFGGTLVIKGHMSIGILTSFMLYTVTLATGFAFVSSLVGEFMSAVGATDRVLEILNRVPAIPIDGGLKPSKFDGHLTFENVEFTYPNRADSMVLKGINLELRPGQVVALVGPSGGGKSTVVGMVERFYEPTKGAVCLDNVDIRSLDLSWYRSHIGLVSQEPVLFACSIKENITFGVQTYLDHVGELSVLHPGELKPTVEIPMSMIVAAAKQANAHDFIESFPDGYNTMVGERGVRLSGGQKQRIAIARALLLDPKLLLLDEATSALDAESEGIVQEAMDNAMKNRTVLIIAHRLSTVRNADVVAVLENGQIVEQGTHDSLMAARGAYFKLVSKQIDGFLGSPLTPAKENCFANQEEAQSEVQELLTPGP